MTATNVQWHPSGRALAVNVNTQDRSAFFTVADDEGSWVLRPWGAPIVVGKDPFVGRFTPDGRHAVVDTAESGPSAEGLAVSPDGRMVATVNMGGSVFLPSSRRFRQDASVTLLRLDPNTGRIARVAQHPLTGSLPEGGAFDRTGEHFVATVFQGHNGTAPAKGPGLEVFRVSQEPASALRSLGRVPLPHGAHHVDIGG